MLVAGRVTITFTSPSGSHITILAKCRMPDQGGQWIGCSLDRAKVINFEVPSAGGGWNDRVGKYTQSKGFVPAKGADPARVYCAKALLAYVAGEPTNPNLVIQEANNCGRCGRELTDPESIALGIGPTCRGSEETSSHHQEKVTVTHGTDRANEVRQSYIDAADAGLLGSKEYAAVVKTRMIQHDVQDARKNTDKKGRELPTTFDELAARVKV